MKPKPGTRFCFKGLSGKRESHVLCLRTIPRIPLAMAAQDSGSCSPRHPRVFPVCICVFVCVEGEGEMDAVSPVVSALHPLLFSELLTILSVKNSPVDQCGQDVDAELYL